MKVKVTGYLIKTDSYINNQLSNKILMLREMYLILADTNLRCCFINTFNIYHIK